MIVYINRDSGQRVTITRTKRWFWLPKIFKRDHAPMWACKFMAFKLQIWYV